MNIEKALVHTKSPATSFASLESSLQGLSLEAQVEKLKQVVMLQQQMLSFQSSISSGLEMQHKQVQVLSDRGMLAQNNHVQDLEEALRLQGLREERALCLIENVTLRNQIEQMVTIQQMSWKTSVNFLKDKIAIMRAKMGELLQELSAVKEKNQYALEWKGKVFPNVNRTGVDISGVLAFNAAFPGKNFTHIRRDFNEHFVADLYYDVIEKISPPTFKVDDLSKKWDKASQMLIQLTHSMEMPPHVEIERELQAIKSSNIGLKALSTKEQCIYRLFKRRGRCA